MGGRSDLELPRQVLGARPFQASTARRRVGELSRELAKQRRGLGMRTLMICYGDLIAEVMPCVLVSPDSLARFFPPDPDLSEAALARVPSRWLSWHYRSQDETLIAFGNRHHYEDRLSSFPAPTDAAGEPCASTGAEDRGISLVRVDGHFHRSGERARLRTNPVEAQAVVAEIRRRFDASPDAMPSVGVVTFNAQQRTLVERLLLESGDERLVTALQGSEEGLFVKNLENVQGDERDVILFSTAFSVNDRGVLPLNFGPLNRGGGERRLNVAVTRARRQVMVFSSFDPEQLRAQQTSSLGIKHLRAYLDLAAHGPSSLGQGERRLAVVDRHRDEVAGALRRRGLVVRTDVGLSDFKVDLSVALPGAPSRPVMAVLLDGAGWAKRRSVGDRDGLPREVLSRLMRWPSVERVWLPAWLADPDAVVDRLVDAAGNAAVTGATAAAPPAAAPQPVVEPPAGLQAETTVEPDDVAASAPESSRLIAGMTDVAADTSPSVPASNSPVALRDGETVLVPWEPSHLGPRVTLDGMASKRGRDAVARALEQAVTAEGPVQEERLAKLVAGGFGLKRVSGDRVATILAQLPRVLRARVDDGFVWPPDKDPTTWTGFRRAPIGLPRPVEEVSLREIGNAMVALCATSGGIGRDELCREALAVFGGRRLTPNIAQRMQDAVDMALTQQRLQPGPGGSLVIDRG